MLVGVYRVPRLARACTMHSCITHKGFLFACNVTCEGFLFAGKSTTNTCSWLCTGETCIFARGYNAQALSLNRVVPYLALP